MSIFDNENYIEISKEDINDAALACKDIDSSSKKRALANVIGARIGIRFLHDIGIKSSNFDSLYSIPAVLKDTDISDIKTDGNIKIDVRIVQDENHLFIPKSHFKYDILPEIYIFFAIEKDNSAVHFLGAIAPEEIDKSNENKDYYFITSNSLYNINSLKEVCAKTKPAANYSVDDSEMLKAENILVSFIDGDSTEEDKQFLYGTLKKSSVLRSTFKDFQKFELISTDLANTDEILNDSVLDTIGAGKIYQNDLIDNVYNSDVNLDELADQTVADFVEDYIYDDKDSEMAENDDIIEGEFKELPSQEETFEEFQEVGELEQLPSDEVLASLSDNSFVNFEETINEDFSLTESNEVLEENSEVGLYNTETESIESLNTLDESQDLQSIEPQEDFHTAVEQDLLPENTKPLPERDTEYDGVFEEVIDYDSVNVNSENFENITDIENGNYTEETVDKSFVETENANTGIQDYSEPEINSFSEPSDTSFTEVNDIHEEIQDNVEEEGHFEEFPSDTEFAEVGDISEQSDNSSTELDNSTAVQDIVASDYSSDNNYLEQDNITDENGIDFELNNDIDLSLPELSPNANLPMNNEDEDEVQDDENVVEQVKNEENDIEFGFSSLKSDMDTQPQPPKRKKASLFDNYEGPLNTVDEVLDPVNQYLKDEEHRINEKEEDTVDINPELFTHEAYSSSLNRFEMSVVNDPETLRKQNENTSNEEELISLDAFSADITTEAENQNSTEEFDASLFDSFTSDSEDENTARDDQNSQESKENGDDFDISMLDEDNQASDTTALGSVNLDELDNDNDDNMDALLAETSNLDEKVDELLNDSSLNIEDIDIDNIDELNFLNDTDNAEQVQETSTSLDDIPEVSADALQEELFGTQSDNAQENQPNDEYVPDFNQNDQKTIEQLYDDNNAGQVPGEAMNQSFDDNNLNIPQANDAKPKKKSSVPLLIGVMVIALIGYGYMQKDFLMGQINQLIPKQKTEVPQNNNMPIEGEDTPEEINEPEMKPENQEETPAQIEPEDKKPIGNIPGEKGGPQDAKSMEDSLKQKASLNSETNKFTPAPQPLQTKEVKRFYWEIPEDLKYNEAIVNYLKTVGKASKFAISSDILNTTEYPYSNKMIVVATVQKDGNTDNVNIAVSSGSKQIDEVVLQSVKAALKYVKVPTSEFSKESYEFSLIINF